MLTDDDQFFPTQPPKASLERSKAMIQSQNTSTNQIIPRWTKTKVNCGFSSCELILRKIQRKRLFFPVSLPLRFSLVGSALSAISKSTWGKLGGRQIERGVGTRAGRGGGFVRTSKLFQKKAFLKRILKKSPGGGVVRTSKLFQKASKKIKKRALEEVLSEPPS